MACYHPLDAYRTGSGSVTIGYERPGSTAKLLIPCGSCFGCRMEYARTWAIRCQHEAKLWDSNLFVTLTYDEAHLEWHRSLSVEHLQLFIKRLRKSYDGDVSIPESGARRPIRYFAAGEYGTQTARPHYHLLLFNLRLPDYGIGTGIELESMRNLWPYGQHRVDLFTPGRASYVAGYAAKKVRGRMARKLAYEVLHPETGEVVERKPEFATQSNRPGLGYWWFRRHERDFRRGYASSLGGTKDRLPRYYRDKLLQDPEWAYDDEDRAQEYLLSLDPAEQTPERRKAREDVHKARFSHFTQERL